MVDCKRDGEHNVDGFVDFQKVWAAGPSYLLKQNHLTEYIEIRPTVCLFGHFSYCQHTDHFTVETNNVRHKAVINMVFVPSGDMDKKVSW